MVTHNGPDFREKCSLAHFFSHPFIQQLVSAFDTPDTAVDTKDKLEIQQGLGPHGASSLMRVKHSKTCKDVRYNGMQCRVLECSGSC